MAKYSRFDVRNKKKSRDKYRSDKGRPKNDKNKEKVTYSGSDLKQLEKTSAR